MTLEETKKKFDLADIEISRVEKEITENENRQGELWLERKKLTEEWIKTQREYSKELAEQKSRG